MRYIIQELCHRNLPGIRRTLPVIILAVLFFSVFFAGCKKDYINGDLDGLWQLDEITVKGEDVPVDGRRYWSFSFHVVQLSEYGGAVSKGNLSYDGSSVCVDFPFDQSEEGALLIRKWGVYENPVTFRVDYLDSSTLKMTAGDVSLRLRKF